MKKIDILLDCGTTYSKIFKIKSQEYCVIPTKHIREKISEFSVIAATGHNARLFTKNVTNELLALAKGSKVLIGADETATVVDCGSRDIKYIYTGPSKKISIDWNTECGAFCGQIVELLVNYFQFDIKQIQTAQKPIPLTCGILGLTRMFDLISEGMSPSVAFAGLIKGLADNVYQFTGKPRKLYLSGGFCDNPLFISSFSNVEVVSIGRFVLIEGLKESI